MGEYADDAIDRDLNSMFEYDTDGNFDDHNWSVIVRHCRKHSGPKNVPSRNERAFRKFLNKPIDYRDF